MINGRRALVKKVRKVKATPAPQKFIAESAQREASLRAQALFTELDTDGSGELDREEFIQGCLTAFTPRDIPTVKIDHVE